MPKTVLIPLPTHDFDPTEAAVPWRILSSAGLQITFATPDALPAHCDARMLNGRGLGILAPLLCADKNAQEAYAEMSNAPEFLNPKKWSNMNHQEFDGVLLPGGHAPGMREYLESPILQKLVAEFFKFDKPVGAICHGVVLAARSKAESGQSVLFHRKTTALLASQELAAWLLTSLWLGNYYRTYPATVETEVKANLAHPAQFVKGPSPIRRDSLQNLRPGFIVQDRNYISARWPGDAHTFGSKFLTMLQ